MTVGGSSMYGYAFTSVRLSVSQVDSPVASSTASSSPTNSQAALVTDTVTVSPEATAVATAEVAETTTAGSSGLTVRTLAGQSYAERQAEALLTALDADEDGSITGQEFTEGARALLRRAAAEQRSDRAHRHHHGRESRGVHRLGRRLERLFDHVDANADGGISNDELVAALSGRGPRPERSKPTPPEPSAGSTNASPAAPTVAVAVSFASVTYVAVAVQSYSAVLQLGSPQSETTGHLPSQLTA